MKDVPVSSLAAGTYYDEPVYLDSSYILLTPDSPVTPELLKRLQKWRYVNVATEGKPKDVPGYMSKAAAGNVAPQTIDEGIQQSAQEEAAQRFDAELSMFADGLFTKFSLEGTLSLGQVTEWIKKTIQMVHDSRDFLLRYLNVSADGDGYMISHAVNTTILALAIGDYLKMPPHRLIELGQACILHEIGMLKLPPELRRTSRSLSPEERKAMSTHTVLGYRIIKGFSAPENVALAALEHHERIDGSGYPRALATPKISEYALITGVACSYDAMLSRRPFRARHAGRPCQHPRPRAEKPKAIRRADPQGACVHAVRLPGGHRGAAVQFQQGRGREDRRRQAALSGGPRGAGPGRKESRRAAPCAGVRR